MTSEPNTYTRLIRYTLRLYVLSVALIACVIPTVQAKEPANRPTITNRIVGGSVVENSHFDYMVALFLDRSGFGEFRLSCGGTQISARWILTAAHCLQDLKNQSVFKPSQLGVWIGAKDLSSSTGSFVPVVSVKIHPEYNPVTNIADIALIELQDEFEGQYAVLPDSTSSIPVSGELGTVVGWGALSEDGPLSPVLREVSLPIVSSAACFPYYQRSFDAKANFCAGRVTGGVDSCQGDSGGPVMVSRQDQFILAGIVSYGDGCARRGVPGVYTRITSYSDWVTETVLDTTLVFDRSVAEKSDSQLQFLEADSSTSGRLAKGEIALFAVIGAERVELVSSSGDADLFLSSSEGLASLEQIDGQSISCISESSTSLDSCEVSNPTVISYATVYAYSDSTFTISTRSSAEQIPSVVTFALPVDLELAEPATEPLEPESRPGPDEPDVPRPQITVAEIIEADVNEPFGNEAEAAVSNPASVDPEPGGAEMASNEPVDEIVLEPAGGGGVGLRILLLLLAVSVHRQYQHFRHEVL